MAEIGKPQREREITPATEPIPARPAPEREPEIAPEPQRVTEPQPSPLVPA